MKKIRFVEQIHQTECGLCCISMVLSYYKSYMTVSELRKIVEIGRDGSNLLQMSLLLRKLDFKTKTYETSLDGLKTIKHPCILLWNNNHFVVLEKIGKKITILDPAFDRRIIDEEEFVRHYSNVVLTLEPTDKFKPSKKKEPNYKMFINEIIQSKNMFILTFVLSLISSGIMLSVPILVQKLFDNIRNIELKENVIFIALILILSITSISLLRGIISARLNAILNSSMAYKVFKHLLSVPYKYFELRPSGDILQRVNSIEVIKGILSDKSINVVLDIISFIVVLVYMFYKSFYLGFMSLIIVFILLLITLIMSGKMKEFSLYDLYERGKVQRIQIDTLSSIFMIKTNALEQDIESQWKNQMDKSIIKTLKRDYLFSIYNVLNQTIQLLGPIIVLLIVFKLNQTTIGEMIAFYTITVYLFSVVTSIFRVMNDIIVVNNNLERLKDIVDYDIEKDINKNESTIFKGNINIKNVSFSYTKDSKLVLNDVSMNIKEGQKVAIVGESGSGKSTLAKLILGLYELYDGDILYDGISIKDINKKNLRRQLGVVPQDVTLQNTTIYNNIKFGKANVTKRDIIEACKITEIYDDIFNMPLKFDTIISNLGQNLSGGQRQRIALARAISNNPSIIILDEATSSLDRINERLITEHFREKNCTQIVIAHRLSTIRDADCIYVMKDGSIVESGTHKELLDKKGYYYLLYKGL